MFVISDQASMRGRQVLPVAAAATILLASCGGGGGSGGNGYMAPPPPAPTVTVSVDPGTITLGQSATVKWSSTNATACTASGAWSGSQATSGQSTVTPTADGALTYTLMCSGGNQQAQQGAPLQVDSAYSSTILVSDMAGVSINGNADANLKNPWGIVAGPTTPFWVANNHSDTSTLYDGTGKPQFNLIVTLPTGFGSTGIVFNTTQDFQVAGAPALFLFDGEGGMLAGWNPNAVKTAVVTYPAQGGSSGGAIYKGLALAAVNSVNYLYATDFHNNKVDVFNGAFAKQTWPATAFVDPNLPTGYAPYGIQAINNGANGATQLYVVYAQQDADKQDATIGPGLGLVDIYDTSGTFVKRLITGGQLNEPWGVASAPPDFGTFSGALLVGNFGDGIINVFDPATGAYKGTIKDTKGNPIAFPGLWGIAFGNGSVNQPKNTLFLAAGTNDENDGAYARIDVGVTPPTLSTVK